MHAVLLARTPIARRVVSQSVRCLASKPPPPPKVPAMEPQRPPPPAPAPSPSLPSLDFAPSTEEEMRRERTGARSSKDSLSSIERRRRFMARGAMLVAVIGAGVETWYMGRDWEADELKAKKLRIEDAPSTRWGRTKERFTSMFDFFTEPLWPELLPPPLPGQMQKPYTLLVSVDDLLVTSTWDRQHGWRTAKRPGVDYFLAYLSQFYEIVIFTTQYHYTATPIIEKLDPYQFYISYRLFRDATRSINGQPIKDLTYLNRDLSKVILLDAHPEHISAQPENAVVIPKWTGEVRDKGLIAMIPFLESIAIYKPQDVRPILEAYHGQDIPIEYAKKEAEATRKHIEEWENNRRGFSTSSFTLSNLFGGPGQPQNTSPVPPTYLEQKRREAQLQYQEEQSYIHANKDNFDRLIKEDQEAMAKEMSGTFWGVAEAFLRGGPPKKEGEGAQPKAGKGSEVSVPVTDGKTSP
ncbi:Mitochondrial import inner membrane translocase subunit TIM50 [Sparassis crispa]|uniref:Mitochondrial import inner membrane translocase subunit TIM50 n=1 Tax=Sparassis crispa TaxID=139825 RepID=A0A401GFG6_9APHY|nr:Mitochondrial import inner membrane translocase subunit TIM50 [Sparassis crispa]GBE80843.1 Mitochondrial import inner membrane translocase subunit TIM50 [Sparassis crispa]